MAGETRQQRPATDPDRAAAAPGLSTRVVLPLVGAFTLILASCTAGEPPAGIPGSLSSAPPRSSAAPELPAAPTSSPAATSGALDAGTLPAPVALGPGWEFRVEGADLEEGTGNDTPFQEREPQEIVEYAIPMGCEVRSETPVPDNVLQATYGHEDSRSYAVALRMRFADEGQARQFAADRVSDLRACLDQPDDPFSGAPAPVVSLAVDGDLSTVEYRLVGEPATWLSVALVSGPDVLTIDTDAEPPSLIDWGGLGLSSP